MRTQVLIVGAGPVGMTLGCELARFGVAARVVDRAAQRTDKSKALVVWSRTLELLDRGPGSDQFIQAGSKVTAVNFIAGERHVGRVDMGSANSPYPYALMLPQSETERLLEEHLHTVGAPVEREVELIGFTQRDDTVEAELRHADGRMESMAADWIVGCDGAHSLVRHTLALPFSGETGNSDWMLADVHMHGYPCPDSEASIYWHKDGVFVIFPISPGRYRVLGDLPPSGAPQPQAPTLEQAQAVIDRRGPGGLKAFDPIWLAGFRINGRKVSNYRTGRAFLAGDAAHVHSPAGGQGMNTGMQDAFNLAWKLALVIKGSCSERLLDSYSAERSYIGDQVLKSADQLTTVATLKNPISQAARNAIAHLLLGLVPVQHKIADMMTEMSIGYPHSPLNGPSLSSHVGPNAGARVAPIAGQAPIGAGSTPRFALFAQTTAAATGLIEKFAALLDPDIRPPFQNGSFWLVRPDGYVACSASEADVIADYLSRLCTI
jgi:2-polyprenyl-6-methoxyphenol hydroxylase-like FAD-dependent oxidoreductase